MEGYVGFDTITQQIEKKLLKRGFHFNVMVVGKLDISYASSSSSLWGVDPYRRLVSSYADISVGQSGLGKSTLVNTIFASHLIESKARLATEEPPRQTTEIQTVSHCECISRLIQLLLLLLLLYI